MTDSITVYILLIGCAEALFLSLVFLKKKDAPQINRYIAVTMFFFLLSMFTRLLSLTGHVKGAVYCGLLFIPSVALIGPVNYFMASSFLGHSKRRRNISIHLVLPFLLFLLYLSTYILFSLLQKPLVTDMQRLHPDLLKIHIPALFVIFFFWCRYLFLSFKQLSQINSRLKKNYSDLSRHSFSWFKIMLLSPLIIMISELINFAYIFFQYNTHSSETYKALVPSLAYSGILFFIAYFVLRHPDVLAYIERLRDEPGLSNLENKKSKNDLRLRITQEQRSTYIEKLNSFMEKEKPYLQESLSIRELAEMIEIPYYHLSIIINDEMSINYYSYIHSYRIKEAIRLLENEDKSILQIAYESGFNSKSTFNKIFKTQTGMTPSEYRKKRS